jgi:selenocysteine-specific elongation factor
MLITEAEKAGKLGLDLSRIKIPGAQKDLRILTRAGLITPLSEIIFLKTDIFNSLVADILRGMAPGESFDIAHAKERTGLSRKYIIPLLNKMEDSGFVEREDNLRRIKHL